MSLELLPMPLRLWVEDALGSDATRRQQASEALARGAPRLAAEPGRMVAELVGADGDQVRVTLETATLPARAFAEAERLAEAAGFLVPDADGETRFMAWRDCLGMVGASLLPDPFELRRQVQGGPGAAADAAVLAVARQAVQDPAPLLCWRGRGNPEVSWQASGFYRPASPPEAVPIDLAARPGRVPEAVLWELGPSGIPVGDQDLEAALAPLYRALARYYSER